VSTQALAEKKLLTFPLQLKTINLAIGVKLKHFRLKTGLFSLT